MNQLISVPLPLLIPPCLLLLGMPDSYKSIMYAASPGKDLPKQTLLDNSQNLLDPRTGGNSDLYDITGFPLGRG
jgi:hypothetical protein